MPSAGQTAAASHGSTSSGSVVHDANRKRTEEKKNFFIRLFILSFAINLIFRVEKVNCCKKLLCYDLNYIVILDENLSFS